MEKNERIAIAETEIANIKGNIAEIKENHGEKLDQILAWQNQQKGSQRTVKIHSGIIGGIAGFFMGLLERATELVGKLGG